MTTNEKFEFKGLDHLALTISDMKRSVDFYHGVLGLPVLHTLEYQNENGDLVGQHWFLGVGEPSNPDAHIALFWWRDGYQHIDKDQVYSDLRPGFKLAKPIGSLIHFNLRVDATKMREYAGKLTAMGVPFRHVTRYAAKDSALQASGLVNVGMRGITTRNEYHQPEEDWLMDSIYVFDPDGIEVEFNAWAPAWRDWPNDAVPVSGADYPPLAAPQPVPAE